MTSMILTLTFVQSSANCFAFIEEAKTQRVKHSELLDFAGENILAMYLDENPTEIPWDAIRYLIAEATGKTLVSMSDGCILFQDASGGFKYVDLHTAITCFTRSMANKTFLLYFDFVRYSDPCRISDSLLPSSRVLHGSTAFLSWDVTKKCVRRQTMEVG